MGRPRYRFAGTRAPVRVNDVLPDAGAPAWRTLHHPGVTGAGDCHELIAVWVHPYPGHAGGFLAQGRPQPVGNAHAQTLDDLFDLFDNEAIAGAEISEYGAYTEALPYLVLVDPLDESVRVQRLPGELSDYTSRFDDAGDARALRRCWCETHHRS